MRMPFEISTVPEKFQRRKEESLDGLDGMKPFHDVETMTRRITIGIRKLEALLQRYFERNIKLNKEK